MVKRKPEASASWEDKRYFAQWNILHISRSQRQGDKIVNEIIETRLAAMKVNTSMTPLWQPSARHVDAAPFIHHSLNAHAVHKAVYTYVRSIYACVMALYPCTCMWIAQESLRLLRKSLFVWLSLCQACEPTQKTHRRRPRPRPGRTGNMNNCNSNCNKHCCNNGNVLQLNACQMQFN